jgi:hypothetical protein
MKIRLQSPIDGGEIGSMKSSQYAKAFAAVATVAEIFIQTQWPDGKYTAASLAAIGAILVYLVPNAKKGPE